MNNKTHAKDYLSEFIKEIKNQWIILLINKIINTNGKILDDDKKEIYNILLKENDLDNKNCENTKIENLNFTEKTINNDLLLKKITHIKGVNALIHGASISLSNTCNIIFGLNGTGKSGYFRILHNSSPQNSGINKKILSNIYKDNNDSIEANIKYSYENKEYDFHFNNNDKQNLFNQIQFFDTEYLPIYLEENSGNIDIEPLGLHFFTKITNIFDEFKQKLESDKNIIKEKFISNLDQLIKKIHSDELKKLLEKVKTTPLDKQEKEKLFNVSFSTEDETNLKKLQDDKSTIETNNTEDRKKILNTEIIEIDNLNKNLLKLKNDLETNTKNTKDLINDYYLKNENKNKREKEFTIIKDIPYQETKEWQQFITSAIQYTKVIDNSIFDKDTLCIYCHQTLNENAIKITQAYASYLNDKSITEFKNAEGKLNDLKNTIENLNPKLLNTNGNILDWKNEFGISENLNKIINNIKNQILILKNSIENKTKIDQEFILDLLNIDKILDEKLLEKREVFKTINADDETKKTKIQDMLLKINELEDKKNIYENKKEIEKNISHNDRINKYLSVIKKINTAPISRLSKTAHEELITEKLKKDFQEELTFLIKNIIVKVEDTKGKKGSSQRKLFIYNDNDKKHDGNIAEILSDGEQKAVAIALFIAENKIQQNKYPIIFDDPVTSIDHSIADDLAKRLIELSTKKQIIIFTHNKLFYDSLIYWLKKVKNNKNESLFHICCNYPFDKCDKNKGYHAYIYEITKHSKDKTGIVYKKEKTSCQYFIENANKKIKQNNIHGACFDLRLAIENFIDEKILLDISLTKNRSRSDNNINWENLKKLQERENKIDIDTLKEHWDTLSSRSTHSTAQSNENPLQQDELQEIIKFLKKYYYSKDN